MSKERSPIFVLIYERRLRSFPELRKQLAALDGDAGVRVVGRYEGAKCFAFVTRFHEKYTLLVCKAQGKELEVPGKALTSKEFDGVASLLSFLATIAGQTLEAYAY
ncbi:MAG TPA: hypothetical protein VEC02_07780 [Nitrososphaerales archaeon]|nr:hypothetical protein [Nitrososphaerales archaeon]